MTTIAYDGKCIAGDRQMTWSGTPSDTKKVFATEHPERGRIIYGCTGNSSDAQAFTRWLDGKSPEPTFTELFVLAIDERGKIWLMDEKKTWALIGAKQWAIGSGADYALGAMAAGKSAREAVVIASKLDVYTGRGVDEIRLIRKTRGSK